MGCGTTLRVTPFIPAFQSLGITRKNTALVGAQGRHEKAADYLVPVLLYHVDRAEKNSLGPDFSEPIYLIVLYHHFHL